MKHVFALAVLMLALAIFAYGCAQPEQPSTPPGNLPEEPQPQQQVPPEAPALASNITITLDLQKTSFLVGENFTGRYTVENTGDTLRAYIIFSCKNEKYPQLCDGRSIHYVSGKSSSPLHACEVKERSSNCILKKFESPGTYIYSVALYSCEEIESALGTECEDAETEDVRTSITPLQTAEKKITVTDS